MLQNREGTRRYARKTCLVIAATTMSLGVLVPSAAAQDTRSRQWYLDAMQAERMWKVSTGKGVTVAVIDSGVDTSVPELKGRVLPGKDVTEQPDSAHKDASGHGTEMAALIAGTGAGNGVQGLAPGVKIIPVKSDDESVVFSDSEKGMSDAIRYAADSDARIINISLTSFYEEKPPRVQSAVDYAVGKGKIIFAGTGNAGGKDNSSTYPANLAGVVGVAATDESGTVTKFSTYGPQVALAAPGDNIPGRCKGSSEFCKQGGTSHATALASASAALIWSKHPTWTNNQVLRVMMETAGKPEGKVPSKYIGYGVIRPRQVLLEGKGSPGAADTNPLFPDYHPSGKASSPTATPSRGTEKLDDSKSSNRAPAASAGDDSDGPGPMLWAGVAGAIVLVVGGAIFLVRRRTAQAGG